MTAAPFIGHAEFSPCGRYRYRLERTWPDVPNTGKLITFVMLNPSTATADVDDTTVAKCGRFARRWGGTQLVVVNLYALRATDPRKLKEVVDPVGLENDGAIRSAIDISSLVICAWGNHGSHLGRAAYVRKMFRIAPDYIRDRIHYLKLNGNGEPAHPLYLREASMPTRWETI